MLCFNMALTGLPIWFESKIDLVFLSAYDRGPSFEPRSFGMAARVANHKATDAMNGSRESMNCMVAPHKH
jgi:hypothetical protein